MVKNARVVENGGLNNIGHYTQIVLQTVHGVTILLIEWIELWL